MNYLNNKEIYLEDDRKVLEVDILSEKYCNFDCVFCPFEQTENKIEEPMTFVETAEALDRFRELLATEKPDLVYLSSKGEALFNQAAGPIIDFIKSQGVQVRLLSNGYLLGQEHYLKVASKCDEVIGERAAVTEADFHKLQRPLSFYSLEEYITNMIEFNQQYDGDFILDITMLKGYNDDQDSLERMKAIIARISPDSLDIGNPSDEKVSRQFGLSPERLQQISKTLGEN